MDQSSEIASIWSLVTVLVPILLAAIALWAVMRGRDRYRASRDETLSARELYDRSGHGSKIHKHNS